MTSKFYVVPDLHGRYDLLQLFLQQVYASDTEGGHVVFLGDYIDRGPGSAHIVATLMSPPEGWQFTCLKGNHEEMVVETVRSFQRGYGFNQLYDPSILDQFGVEDRISYTDFPEDVLKWMESLPEHHIIGKNVFAHAWYDSTLPPQHQNSYELLWTRMTDSSMFPAGPKGYFLTHGHTPKRHGPIAAPNRINLDTGAVWTGILHVGVYDKDKRGPVDFLTFNVEPMASEQ